MQEPGCWPIVSTYNAADPLAWRQWHHWNLAPEIAKLRLPAGKTVLTVHIVTGGQMNLATFDFKKTNRRIEFQRPAVDR